MEFNTSTGTKSSLLIPLPLTLSLFLIVTYNTQGHHDLFVMRQQNNIAIAPSPGIHHSPWSESGLEEP